MSKRKVVRGGPYRYRNLPKNQADRNALARAFLAAVFVRRRTPTVSFAPHRWATEHAGPFGVAVETSGGFDCWPTYAPGTAHGSWKRATHVKSEADAVRWCAVGWRP